MAILICGLQGENWLPSSISILRRTGLGCLCLLCSSHFGASKQCSRQPNPAAFNLSISIQSGLSDHQRQTHKTPCDCERDGRSVYIHMRIKSGWACRGKEGRKEGGQVKTEGIAGRRRRRRRRRWANRLEFPWRHAHVQSRHLLCQLPNAPCCGTEHSFKSGFVL